MRILGKLYGETNEIENIRLDLIDELPSSGFTGQIVFVTSLSTPYVYTGSSWKQIVLSDFGAPLSAVTNFLVTNTFSVNGNTTLNKLTVQDDTVLENNVSVKHNYILLNYGETAYGVSQFGTTAGFWIDRGNEDNIALLWFENDDAWKITYNGTDFYDIMSSYTGDTTYLKLDGTNTPTADISMNNNKITNIKDATDDYDVVGYKFVNDRYLRLDGTNSLIADIDFNNYAIINLKDPINNQDAATKNYVDDQIDNAPFLKLDGTNSPTHHINWNANRITNLDDPIAEQDAATRKYVDQGIKNHDSEHYDTFLRLDGQNYPISNINMNNYKITNLADPSDSQDAVTKHYIDNLLGSGMSGDTGVYVTGIDSGGSYMSSLNWVNIVILSNAANFGTLYETSRADADATSNGPRDRGVIFGGYDASGVVLNSIEYITISSPGNAQYYGSMSAATRLGGAFSNA